MLSIPNATAIFLQNCNSSLSKFIDKTYEFDPTIICGYTITEEEEQTIYDTPDEEDYDHIYTNPPTEEEEIYEVLKGKNVNKFYQQHIRYNAVYDAVTITITVIIGYLSV